MSAQSESACWRGVPAVLRSAGIAITTAALAVCAALIALEEWWARPTPLDDAAAFREGTIGTEQAPLVVFEALPGIFSEGVDFFQPLGPGRGDWIDQFGLIRRGDSPLPVGLYVSHLRPQSGAGSPVPFVGLACAVCHSSELRISESDPGTVFIGAGTPHADILAFSDAIRGAIVAKDSDGRHRLSTESISRVLKAKRGSGLTATEWLVVQAWLSGVPPAVIAASVLRATGFRTLPSNCAQSP